MSVAAYLENECGVKRDFVKKLVEKHKDIINQGKMRGKYPYYIAGEILKAENVSEEWEGYDLNWVEPKEDNDAE